MSRKIGNHSESIPERGKSVLVVGGGPAGLVTAAELARQGVPVGVVERSRYDDVRVGEHLSPKGVLRLRALDLVGPNLLAEAHLASTGVDASWGSETENHMDYFLHPGQHGMNLSRPRFDADLAAACERTGAVVMRSASLRRAFRTSKRWELEIDIGGMTKLSSAAVVVDATGRAAAFARSQGVKVNACDRQVAIVAIDESGDDRTRADPRLVIEAAELGWWYGASISSRKSICMFITDADLVPRGERKNLRFWWLDQLGRTTHIAKRFCDQRNSQRLVVRSARSQRLECPYGTEWLAVGDAAMAFDPLASQGIEKALAQGVRAASSILAHLSGDPEALGQFARDLHREYSSYRMTRADYYRMETRWPQSTFWRRRQK